MSIWKLTIRLDEPFCCAAKPLEGNETPTTPYIPATTLRGAMASALYFRDRTDLLETWFGTRGPRWLPAWPKATENELIVPTPLCYAMEKGDPPRRIRNLFLEPAQQDPPIQWQSFTQPFFRIDAASGQPQEPVRATQETQMHVGLDYARQASRERALYSRSELASGSLFEAFVDDPGNVLTQDLLNGEVYMGKRRSAGSGRAQVTAEQVPAYPWSGLCSTQTESRVTLQLMTDAIVPAQSGGYWRGLTREMLVELRVPAVELKHAFCRAEPVFGWSVKWEIPREPAVAVRAGSVCEFMLGEQLPTADRRAALAWLHQGIGIRRREGFGVVALNPKWLKLANPKDRTEGGLVFKEKDAATLPQDYLLVYAAERLARAAHASEKLSRKVRDLSTYSLRVSSPNGSKMPVTDYLNHMGGRKNDHGWRDAGVHLGKELQHATNMEEARFLLAAAATLLDQGEQQ